MRSFAKLQSQIKIISQRRESWKVPDGNHIDLQYLNIQARELSCIQIWWLVSKLVQHDCWVTFDKNIIQSLKMFQWRCFGLWENTREISLGRKWESPPKRRRRQFEVSVDYQQKVFCRIGCFDPPNFHWTKLTKCIFCIKWKENFCRLSYGKIWSLHSTKGSPMQGF